MKKLFILSIASLALIATTPASSAQQFEGKNKRGGAVPTTAVAKAAVPTPAIPTETVPASIDQQYAVGVDDVLEISVLKPELLTQLVTVSPDGSIAFPYIGNVNVKGLSISQVQETIQSRLADGYMRYPVVSVALRESRSRKFSVYGEVLKPGSYPIEENMTVLRAISMAGGFTRFGSSSRVKVLRPKKTGPGYEAIKVNIKAVMDGNSDEDVLLKQGDIVTVSEGVF
jgi:polysaccharide biosynthesis/export protein